MARGWKMTTTQAQTFVDELTELIEDYDFGLPELFTVRGTTGARFPKSWPRFFRALAGALEEGNATTNKRRSKEL